MDVAQDQGGESASVHAVTDEITIVGVSDADADSRDSVERAIENTAPATVAVGIDPLRRSQLEATDQDIAPSDVMSGKTGYQFLGYWLSAELRERVAEHEPTEPGSGLYTLTKAAAEAPIEPIDRDLGDTAQRLWATMGAVTKTAIVTSLTARLAGGTGRAAGAIGFFQGLLFGAIIGLFGGPFFLPADLAGGLPAGGALVQTLDTILLIVAFGVVFTVPLYGLLRVGEKRFASNRPAAVGGVDGLTAVIDAFAGHPAAATDLHEQRAAYMAHRLDALAADGPILAVVDHRAVEPIKQAVQTPEGRPPLDVITGPVSTSRLKSGLYKGIGYGFTVLFLALILLVALGSVGETVFLGLFGAWFLVNFVAAAGTAYVLGAHWKSATAGGLVAWFTSVNPTITPGLFIAYVELRYRTVRLSDLAGIKSNLTGEEPLRRRINRLRAENGLFHILFVITFANLISFFAGVAFVAALLPVFGAGVGGFDELGAALATSIEDGIAVVRRILGV